MLGKERNTIQQSMASSDEIVSDRRKLSDYESREFRVRSVIDVFERDWGRNLVFGDE